MIIIFAHCELFDCRNLKMKFDKNVDDFFDTIEERYRDASNKVIHPTSASIVNENSIDIRDNSIYPHNRLTMSMEFPSNKCLCRLEFSNTYHNRVTKDIVYIRKSERPISNFINKLFRRPYTYNVLYIVSETNSDDTIKIKVRNSLFFLKTWLYSFTLATM